MFKNLSNLPAGKLPSLMTTLELLTEERWQKYLAGMITFLTGSANRIVPIKSGGLDTSGFISEQLKTYQAALLEHTACAATVSKPFPTGLSEKISNCMAAIASSERRLAEAKEALIEVFHSTPLGIRLLNGLNQVLMARDDTLDEMKRYFCAAAMPEPLVHCPSQPFAAPKASQALEPLLSGGLYASAPTTRQKAAIGFQWAVSAVGAVIGARGVQNVARGISGRNQGTGKDGEKQPGRINHLLWGIGQLGAAAAAIYFSVLRGLSLAKA